ncbi:MAG: B12-binding domain-containing radical SAM protein [Armatimonadetes bacterium]|nr:B12-binding domain-containing radical SAM protein [Armatimonadota bacterium]
MQVKMILPALTEARSPYWRSIKYSLFPPLGLATLAGYLSDSDVVTIQDEHVERLDLSDEPDLVVIEAYITSAYRSYEIADHYRAKGCYVVMGGLHVTSMPDEAAAHADTICLGPGEDTWPAFLSDFRNGSPHKVYQSLERTLLGQPLVRRDLIKRHLYLAPNSLVVSRGCPHACDFCYKEAFFAGGKSFYTQSVDDALAEIERLPGKHLFFLDDNIFADSHFARALFDGMKGMGRIWQAAGTVQSAFEPGLLESAVESGLRSLFVGFETLSASNLREQGKYHNLHGDYNTAVRRLHELGVMINASFVFGLDHDDEATPARTVEWAIEQGIETATFHILTPYPGTALRRRLTEAGRITTSNWDLYDTRHVVYQPANVSPSALEDGYWEAYRDFYSWGSIFKGARAKSELTEKLRHVVYSGAWKKMEPLWKLAVQARRVSSFGPLLETVLSGAKSRRNRRSERNPKPSLTPGAES